MVSAHKGSAMLASQLASYAQQQSEESLKGGLKYCESTGVLGSIIGLLLSIVVMYFCAYCAKIMKVVKLTATAAKALKTATLILNVATIAVNVLVIQPTITNLWNSLQMNLKIEDRMLETGLSTAMQEIVSDGAQVPDYSDMDLDGLWYDDLSSDGNGNSTDTINRYAYHYTRRLQSVMYAPIPEIAGFVNGLESLMGHDDWAYAPEESSCSIADARCDTCCAPPTLDYMPQEDGTTETRLEERCSDSVTRCSSSSPYGARYPYAYDPLFGLSGDSFLSMFGNDDNNADFHGSTANTPRRFLKSDASGMFRTFWTLSELDIDRYITLNISSSIKESLALDMFQKPRDFIAEDGECADQLCQGNTCLWKKGLDSFCSEEAPYDEGCQRHKNAGCPTMTLEEFQEELEAATTEEGRDEVLQRYERTLECSCRDALSSGVSAIDDMPFWAEDSFDRMRNQSVSFLELVDSMTAMPTRNLELMFASWYPNVETWISNTPIRFTDPYGVTVEQDKGILYQWIDTLRAARSKLIDWKQEAVDGGDAFCATNQFGDLDSSESDHITNTLLLDRQVIQCLDFHSYEAPRIWQTCGDALDEQLTAGDRLEQCLEDCDNMTTPIDWGACVEAYEDAEREANNEYEDCLKESIHEDTCEANRTQSLADADAIRQACFNGYENPGNPLECRATYEDVVKKADTEYWRCVNEEQGGVTGGACEEAFRDTESAAAEARDTCITGTPKDDDVTPEQIQACKEGCEDGRSESIPEACLDEEGELDLPRPLDNNSDNPEDMTLEELLTYVRRSGQLSSAHDSEFAHRRDQVDSIYREVDQLIAQYDRAIFEFEAFLEGPAKALRQFANKKLCTQAHVDDTGKCGKEDQDISNFIIYGWKTYPDNRTDDDEGRWHVARVEGVIPKRCGNSSYCNTNRIPWLKTSTKGFLATKRCYYLRDYQGRVAIRSTRWDQSNNNEDIKLPGGAKLWKFRMSKPGAEDISADFSICHKLDPYLFNENEASDVAKEAFMINRYPTLKSFCHLFDEDKSRRVEKVRRACEWAQQCWKKSEAVLANGIQTTSCAEYFWDGKQQDMSLRFIDCDQHNPPFVRDENFYTIDQDDEDILPGELGCEGDVEEVCAEVWNTDQNEYFDRSFEAPQR